MANMAVNRDAAPASAASLRAAFANAARTHSSRTAMVDGVRTWTYAELDLASDAHAAALARLGVVRGEVVGIHMSRCAEAVIAMLAIAKLGAVYLPFDPAAPDQRLAAQADAARVRVVVIAEGQSVPIWAAQRIPHAIGTATPDVPERVPLPDVHELELAYVMYTSGSSGEPKGVCVTHRGVVDLAMRANCADIGPHDVVGQVMSIAFDGATFEIWGSLLNGACLAMAPPNVSANGLCAFVEERGVTILLLSTGLFNSLPRDALRRLSGLRMLFAGGDVMSSQTAHDFLMAGGTLANVYGPTEITTFSHCHVMAATQGETESIPIGLPVPGTSAYVLDADLHPVPIGEEGELYLAGTGLAQGYLDNPGLTAERFLPDPFLADGARMYRTGDLVRQSPQGWLEYIGRIDTQVKIRGFRVELSEVEAGLCAAGDLLAACVVHVRNADASMLVAYCVARAATEINEAALVQNLRQRLPDYMLPRHVVFLPELPLTINGKVDRAQLAAAARARIAPVAAIETEDASDGLEGQLLTQFRRLLGNQQLDVDDNFFDAGGDSLTAMRFCAHLDERHGIELPLSMLFEADSLGAVIARVRQLNSAAASARIPTPQTAA